MKNTQHLCKSWISAPLCLYVFYLLKTQKKRWEQGPEYRFSLPPRNLLKSPRCSSCTGTAWNPSTAQSSMPFCSLAHNTLPTGSEDGNVRPPSPLLPHSFRSRHRRKAAWLCACQGEYGYSWRSPSTGQSLWAGTQLVCQRTLHTGGRLNCTRSPWVSQQWPCWLRTRWKKGPNKWLTSMMSILLLAPTFPWLYSGHFSGS